jgi:two-component system OmpR family sensor kinase
MSLFKKITILFIISFSLMTIIGLWIDNINSKRIEDLIKDKYTKVANELLVNLDNKKKLKEIEKNYDLKQIKPIDSITILHKEALTFGYILIGKKSFEDEFIIQVQYLDEELTYKTQQFHLYFHYINYTGVENEISHTTISNNEFKLCLSCY